MRHGQAGRRMRNRGGSGGGGGNGGHNNNMRRNSGGSGGGGGGGNSGGGYSSNRNHVYDSNGPDVRIRGTAHQIQEKYTTLSKDAASSGDTVLSESYLQHAEHYQRIINSWAEFAPQQRYQTDDDEDLSSPGENRQPDAVSTYVTPAPQPEMAGDAQP